MGEEITRQDWIDPLNIGAKIFGLRTLFFVIFFSNASFASQDGPCKEGVGKYKSQIPAWCKEISAAISSDEKCVKNKFDKVFNELNSPLVLRVN